MFSRSVPHQFVHHDILHIHVVQLNAEHEPTGHVQDPEPRWSLNRAQPLTVGRDDGVVQNFRARTARPEGTLVMARPSTISVAPIRRT